MAVTANQVCRIEGCDTLAKKRGLCFRHGAYPTCKVNGCITGVPGSRFKRCIRYGNGTKTPCPVSGCAQAAPPTLETRVSAAIMAAVQCAARQAAATTWSAGASLKACAGSTAGFDYCGRKECWYPCNHEEVNHRQLVIPQSIYSGVLQGIYTIYSRFYGILVCIYIYSMFSLMMMMTVILECND